jgi:hypothetical protein
MEVVSKIVNRDNNGEIPINPRNNPEIRVTTLVKDNL